MKIKHRKPRQKPRDSYDSLMRAMGLTKRQKSNKKKSIAVKHDPPLRLGRLKSKKEKWLAQKLLDKQLELSAMTIRRHDFERTLKYTTADGIALRGNNGEIFVITIQTRFGAPTLQINRI
jgi:hypothetical protein